VEAAVANGTIKSQSEIDILAANGYIDGELANNLKSQLPEDKFQDDLKQVRPDIEAFIRTQLRASITSAGSDPDAFKDRTMGLVSALTDELMAVGLSKLLEAKSQGRTVGRGQIRSQLQEQAIKDLKTERFAVKTEKGKAVIPDPGKALPTSVPYERGPSGRNYSQQLINRLPKVVSAKRDVLLDAEKVQANINALNNGGQPTPDLVTIAKASGLSVRQVLAQQAQKNGLTYTPSSADAAAKTYEANSKLDPTAATILANPRSTAAQRIRATARLAEARNRKETSTIPLNIDAFRQAIIGKESGGNYRAVNPDSGALGIGQVMPENVGPWTKKYLGKSLTPQQFLNDNAAQDAVVNGRFQDMIADQQAAGFNGEQMIRRAAAVWYSGQAKLWNNTRPQFSKGRQYPSIAEYTKAIWDSYSQRLRSR
jgi:hypothetical protein